MEDRERWAVIREILNEVIPMDPARRGSFVAQRCEGDPQLRDSVLSLVHAYDEIQSTISRTTQGPLAPGTSIGPYELLERIGEGGFGEVFRAEQREPVRRLVALKILKPEMSSREVLARFGGEKQILELMEHVNVARLLDAGRAPGGRPYFVMDHVPGPPITTFCDERKTDIAGRLELFLGVCAGVQHAHQKGIIHRDLKPRNILVSDAGTAPTPKIIDFGLAKAIDRPLSPETIHTVAGGVLGTPDYMAPEQWRARPADVDTRADIYSLGVLLYELLVGETPLPMKGMKDYDEMRRTALDVEPARPSVRLAGLNREESSRRANSRRCEGPAALRAQVGGDLDWIVMKCLEKDRARRYQSAAELTADLERQLRNEPVVARRPTFTYVAGRFVKRHGRSLAVGSILATTVLAALTFGALHAIDRREASRRGALARIENARMLVFSNPKKALAELDEARSLAPNLPELDLAQTLVLARSDRRKEALTRAEETCRRNPESAEAKAMLAGLLRKQDKARSKLLEAEGRKMPDPNRLFDYTLASGLEDDNEALALLTKSLDEFPWNFDAVFQRGIRRYLVGDFDAARSDADLLLKIRPTMDLVWNLRGSARFKLEQDSSDAIRDFTEALAINPKQEIAFVNRAMAFRKSRDFDAASRDVDDALKLDPKDGDAHRLRGAILMETDRNEEAVAAFSSVIAAGANDFRVLKDRGIVLQRLNRCGEAAADFTKAIESEPRPAPTDLSILHDLRGVARRNIDDYDGALADAERAVDLQPGYARAQSNLGLAFLFLGRRPEALASFDRATKLESVEPTWLMYRGVAAWLEGDDPAALRDLGVACRSKGYEMTCFWAWGIHLARGERAAAAQLLADVKTTPNQPPNVLAVAAALQGKRTEAEVIEEIPPGSDRLAAWYVFGCRAAAQGRQADATAWWTKCATFPKPGEVERILARLRLRLESERALK